MKKIEFINSTKDFLTEEAYNALRTNIIFCGEDIKTIAITSSFPNEGKSTVSRSLALNFAKADKKVLFIDADMRKSVTIGNINVEGETSGLSHYLSGQAKLEDIICETKNSENLYAVLTGSFPPNPSELLSSQKFKNFLTEVRSQYDYVIIDTPPVNAVIDAAIIASICDGTIVVIGSNKTRNKAVRSTKAQLEKANCHILGAVLNGAHTSRDTYYNKYYGK